MSPLDIAIAEGRRFIDSQSTRSVAPTGSRADILAPMPTALPATGMDPVDVVRLIARAASRRGDHLRQPQIFPAERAVLVAQQARADGGLERGHRHPRARGQPCRVQRLGRQLGGAPEQLAGHVELARASGQAALVQVTMTGLTDNTFVGSGDPCGTGLSGGNACNSKSIVISIVIIDVAVNVITISNSSPSAWAKV
jgi:hypothetical protein